MKYFIYICLLVLPLFVYSNDWNLMDNLENKKVRSFSCRDSSNCYAVVQYPDSTRILKCTNKGRTWKRIYGSAPLSFPLPTIMPIFNSRWGISPAKNYFFMTDYQFPIIRKSTDDCKSFTDIVLDTLDGTFQKTPEGFDMFDTNLGFLNTVSNFFVTRDGWKTFKKLPEPIKGQYMSPKFLNDSIVGLSLSINQEIGTQYVHYNINQKKLDVLYEFPKDSILNSWYIIMTFQFINDSVGFSCGYLRFNPGGGSYNIIFRTRDGGRDWKLVYKEINSPSFGLSDIAFYDEFNGFAVAPYGNIITTNDGGDTWVLNEKPLQLGEPLNMYATWVGHYPIFGTFDQGGIFRYEGDFFDFTPDSIKPVITAEDKDFGEKDIELQDSTFLTFKIYNNNNGNELKIFGFSALTNSPFSTNLPEIDSLNPLTIEPQGFYEYEVYFKPIAVKQYSDSIVFYSNAKKTDNIAYLSGEGIAFPSIQADNQDFKTKEIHDTTTTIIKIKIHNLSDYTDLNIFGFSQPTESAFANQFVWNDSMTYITVKPNEYFELPVGFKPTEMRKYKDSIIVFSNASMLDSVIVLEGEGIDSTIGVKEDLEETYFEIIPNPAGDYIEIRYKNVQTHNLGVSKGLIEIYNVLGESVKKNLTPTLSKGEGVIKVDVSDLVPAVYFIRLGEFVGRFVKY